MRNIRLKDVPSTRFTDLSGVRVMSCRVPVFHSGTSARSKILRMLMRRPVSCSDPARGIILVEIKFRNSLWSARWLTASLRRNALANSPSLWHYGNRAPLGTFHFLRSLQLCRAIIITACERLQHWEMQNKIFRQQSQRCFTWLIINIMLPAYRIIFIGPVAIHCRKLLRVICKT